MIARPLPDLPDDGRHRYTDPSCLTRPGDAEAAATRKDAGGGSTHIVPDCTHAECPHYDDGMCYDESSDNLPLVLADPDEVRLGGFVILAGFILAVATVVLLLI